MRTGTYNQTCIWTIFHEQQVNPNARLNETIGSTRGKKISDSYLTSLCYRMNKLSMVLCTAYFAAALLFLEFPSDSGYHGRFLLSESHQTVLDDEATTNAMFFSGRPIYIVGLITAFIGIMLSAGGGIGGGGLLVPIFVLIFRLPIKHAVGLSNVTVFGGAVANTILNASKRHPLANRPLVDWNLLSMMEPLTMAGALVGAGINQSLPDVMVVIMLVLLLGVTTMRTLRKV